MMYLAIFVFAVLTASGLGRSINEVEKEPTEPFMCPFCSAVGKNADSECEANIVNKTCLETDPVCFLRVSTESSFAKFRLRDCRSREHYNLTKDDCKQRGNCAMVMCDTSGCKAEFPASERSEEPFSCPVCQGDTLKACDDNISYVECEEDEPVCMLLRIPSGETGRHCYGRDDFNDLKNYCDNNSAECTVAMCDKSGCKAELANSA